jgi:hypothetical protein
MLSTTFTELEGHCELAGYVTDTSVVAATEGVKRMAEIFLGSAAAENLGAFPRIANYLVGEGSSQETKVGYLRQLAIAFSLLLAAVNSAYLRRPAAEAKVSSLPSRARLPFLPLHPLGSSYDLNLSGGVDAGVRRDAPGGVPGRGGAGR